MRIRSGPQSIRAGVGQDSIRFTTASSSGDQFSSGPSGVEAQSKLRIRPAISPLAMIFAVADDKPPDSGDATFEGPDSLILCCLPPLDTANPLGAVITGRWTPGLNRRDFLPVRLGSCAVSTPVMRDSAKVMPRVYGMAQ